MRESHLSEGRPEIVFFQLAVIREIINSSHIFRTISRRIMLLWMTALANSIRPSSLLLSIGSPVSSLSSGPGGLGRSKLISWHVENGEISRLLPTVPNWKAAPVIKNLSFHISGRPVVFHSVRIDLGHLNIRLSKLGLIIYIYILFIPELGE